MIFLHTYGREKPLKRYKVKRQKILMERDEKGLDNIRSKKKKTPHFPCRFSFPARQVDGSGKIKKKKKRNKRNNTRKSHPSILCRTTLRTDKREKWKSKRKRGKETGMGWRKAVREGEREGLRGRRGLKRRQKTVQERSKKKGCRPREQQRKWR